MKHLTNHSLYKRHYNMNIVLSTDNKFVQHCLVTMTSIMENNKDVNFYVITNGLSDFNTEILVKQANKYNCQLKYLYVKNEIIDKLPMPQNKNLRHISPATYYRLFIDELLPKSIDKLIYLDCDMIIRGSLKKLWETPLDDYVMAAVFQNQNWAIKNDAFKRLSIPSQFGYFNAGTLLINLQNWRKECIQEKLLKFLHDNYEKIICHDQDVLNAILYNKTICISPVWNMLTEFYVSKEKDINCGCTSFTASEIEEYQKKAIIIHFVSRPKPWEYACNHPLRYEYYKYLQLTPFCKWKPTFNLRNIWSYKIKPYLLKIKNI